MFAIYLRLSFLIPSQPLAGLPPNPIMVNKLNCVKILIEPALQAAKPCQKYDFVAIGEKLPGIGGDFGEITVNIRLSLTDGG